MEIMVQKRKEKKMTQAELAQAVGCSQRAIAGYELEERKPSVPMAQRIGQVLGFPWTDFYPDGTDGEPGERTKGVNVDAFGEGGAGE